MLWLMQSQRNMKYPFLSPESTWRRIPVLPFRQSCWNNYNYSITARLGSIFRNKAAGIGALEIITSVALLVIKIIWSLTGTSCRQRKSTSPIQGLLMDDYWLSFCSKLALKDFSFVSDWVGNGVQDVAGSVAECSCGAGASEAPKRAA